MDKFKASEKAIFIAISVLFFPFFHLGHVLDFGYFSGALIKHLWRDSIL